MINLMFGSIESWSIERKTLSSTECFCESTRNSAIDVSLVLFITSNPTGKRIPLRKEKENGKLPSRFSSYFVHKEWRFTFSKIERQLLIGGLRFSHRDRLHVSAAVAEKRILDVEQLYFVVLHQRALWEQNHVHDLDDDRVLLRHLQEAEGLCVSSSIGDYKLLPSFDVPHRSWKCRRRRAGRHRRAALQFAIISNPRDRDARRLITLRVDEGEHAAPPVLLPIVLRENVGHLVDRVVGILLNGRVGIVLGIIAILTLDQ